VENCTQRRWGKNSSPKAHKVSKGRGRKERVRFLVETRCQRAKKKKKRKKIGTILGGDGGETTKRQSWKQVVCREKKKGGVKKGVRASFAGEKGKGDASARRNKKKEKELPRQPST